jgi:leader peptidase (prepilin peptidase)/N-methyltransferase
LCAMLIALAFSDLEKRILPDEFTLGGLLAGFAFAPFVRPGAFVHAVLEMAGIQWPETWLNLAEAAFGAVFLSGLLWSAGWIYEKVRHREGLGFGDVKLIAMIGSFLGITGALYTMVLGSVAGSVVGVVYIRATRQEMASYELPFGTFLAFVAMGVALFRWVIPGL